MWASLKLWAGDKMNKKAKLNLLFDLDGCLIDSSEVQKAAFFGSYDRIVGDANCPSWEEYIKHTGDSVDNVLKKLGLPAEMAPVFREISGKSVDKITVNREATDLVKEFKQKGCGTAIVTGKDHYRTADILKYYEIEDYFDILVCADDVSEPKPSPMPIIKALNELHSAAEDAVVIGDGYNDILSAKGAGVRSILTLWFGDEGVPREADYTVGSVKELRAVLTDLYFGD